MNRSIIIGLIAVVIIGGGGFLLLRKNTSNPSTTNNTSTSTSSSSSSGDQQNSGTITYSDSGFSPGNTTVQSGDTVTIKNTASDDLQFESDPHPVHTDDTDLNVGLVKAGQTKTFTVTKTGTFGFHNHLDPSDKATITIL